MITLQVSIAKQELVILHGNSPTTCYPVSTGKNGAGEVYGSGQTPRGLHIIRAKIGEGHAPNSVFVGRRFTGELYTPELRMQYPERDWILTRILWLSGLEVGKNRLGAVDTMRRYIYIHGTPDDVELGVPGSKGCIRMRNTHLIELFDIVKPYTEVMIGTD